MASDCLRAESPYIHRRKRRAFEREKALTALDDRELGLGRRGREPALGGARGRDRRSSGSRCAGEQVRDRSPRERQHRSGVWCVVLLVLLVFVFLMRRECVRLCVIWSDRRYDLE